MSSNADPFVELKAKQRDMWPSFVPNAVFTTPVAAHMVEFAEIKPGEAVLDVGTGTGVVAITAARAGASVTGLDLTPSLLDVARQNSSIAGLDAIQWVEGDVENLPFPDRHFDVVVSQFGHMFAPRPGVTLSEMRRVLKPGGRIAFATWPPEHFFGRLFGFVRKYSPPPPTGAAPSMQWGNPAIVTERLGSGFEPPFFARGVLQFPALSLPHFREFTERSLGPMQKLIETFANDQARLAALRAEFEEVARPYYVGNMIRQDYLLTRANAL
jgi:SAM-dependent methyltransferase